MDWFQEIEMWHSLFELKEDNQSLGYKGDIFFAYDFPQELSTGETKTCIAQPAFSCMHLGKGVFSWILTEKELEEYFQPIEKTFKELEKEKQQEYLQSNTGKE